MRVYYFVITIKQELQGSTNWKNKIKLILFIGCVQVSRIPFNQQIKNFEATLDQITDRLGADGVANAISKCIFFVGMGSNDYLNNYMLPNYDTSNEYNPQQYADLLIQQFTKQLTVCCSSSSNKFEFYSREK